MIAPLLGSRSCPAALPEEEAQGNRVAWEWEQASQKVAAGRNSIACSHVLFEVEHDHHRRLI